MSGRFTTTRSGVISKIVFDDGDMNLLSAAALEELDEVIDLVPDVVRVVELRSGRPAMFAAGADMAEMRGFGAAEAERFSRRGQEVLRRIEGARFVSVAAIDGDCFGGALDLVLAFDIRVATRRSRFSHPGSRIGIVTGFGGTERWRAVVPRHRAARLFLANEVLDAEAARAIELVDEVVDDLDLEIQPILDRLGETAHERIRFARELTARTARSGARGALMLGRHLAELYAEGNDGTD